MKFLSPAKINLNLEVRQRRPDGYHEIQTLMRRIDLADEIEMDREGEGVSLSVEGEETPSGRENLAYRAAHFFFRETKIAGGVRIRLRKRIPVAAGLGGGSSNAATVLMGLRELFQAQIEDRLLMDWGAGIGADVPFFIFKKPAWAGGKGEKLRAAELPADLWFLLLVPPFRISTAWAYAAYDRLEADKPGPFLAQRSFKNIGELPPFMHNDLERSSVGRYPELGEMKEKLREQGAAGALMSGSGPVVFGLFGDADTMKRAEERLSRPAGWRAIPAKGI
ncbi:MAG: ispE [Deltaproteobacteria bacterium]|nr:ispE [Deltaproteobacteria bacterium]